jgi:PTH1 family peptidyl-tRNA hydrolase
MNNSGEVVVALVNRFDLSLSDLCVVYDDLNLEIGVLRLRKKGSDGGHNGMKSIIRCLNTEEFPRLRIGIGTPTYSQIDYVLSEFDELDQVRIDQVVQRAANAVEMLVEDGIQTAMNQFNGRVE